MEVRPIHTLNARGNVLLEVTRDYFKISTAAMFREIQRLRQETEEALALKGIRYADLKTALVPDRQRKEMALVFDRNAIEKSWYGLEVFRRLIPLFDRNSNHSVLVGDYIGASDAQDILFNAMRESVILTRDVDFEYSHQFFVVYINNLTEAMMARFHQELASWQAYIGYADATYASHFKLLLSTMLANAFIKHRTAIIQGHEDDRPNTEDVNMCGYPFGDYGYTCRSIQAQLEGTMLSYKIERPVYPGFEIDTEFALNAINPNPQPLESFSIEVEEAKLGYLKSAKSGSLARAGLEQVSGGELAALIRSKISASYIYNISYDDAHDVSKFNVILELPGSNETATRLLAAMEYKPDSRSLRLITLY
ncbi:hypothetical protein [Agrobacterium sp.]|uniref:hypothetical protein n=1 Tax=Agrobacterium sp. TaxID=361 RepID=UPI00289677E7|nr:hypothetical protein [Agrobacterium sp.]